MAGVIWSPVFEWWMPDPSNRVRYPMTDVFSLLISEDGFTRDLLAVDIQGKVF